MSSVGIEAIGLAVPPTYVDMVDLARARNVEPSKYLEGIGTTRMAVALPDEDTVTLAARAAQAALASAAISPDAIGLLAVGTETGVDHSKPVASYVQSLVGIGRRCRVFETKHACYGGTAALQLALDWIRSGSAAGQKALVICSDIARYGLHTAGEPTQGAGAVAILVSDDPKLVSLEPHKTGIYAHDVHDFWRPLYSKDAFVDGPYSVQCYLDALAGAYQHFRDKNPGVTSDAFAALAYHVPYGKMARKAHRHLRSLDGDPTPDATFDRLVASSLSLCAQVGNIYTGSLYLALTSTLATSPTPLDGQRIGLFSYGSGSCAEFFAGTVTPGAQDRVRALDLPALLDARRQVSIAEYEQVMAERESIDQRPLGAPAGPALRYLGVDANKRVYQPAG